MSVLQLYCGGSSGLASREGSSASSIICSSESAKRLGRRMRCMRSHLSTAWRSPHSGLKAVIHAAPTCQPVRQQLLVSSAWLAVVELGTSYPYICVSRRACRLIAGRWRLWLGLAACWSPAVLCRRLVVTAACGWNANVPSMEFALQRSYLDSLRL